MDKETTEFSRGSFKEKILRQLEENAAKQAETKFPDPEDFERPKGSEPVTSERKLNHGKLNLNRSSFQFSNFQKQMKKKIFKRK